MARKRSFTPFPLEGEPPYVIAHRGVSGKNPENTLAAFSHALQVEGIDMIELDVRLSKEGEVVVVHDRTLQRTTTGNGPVRLYTVPELKALDAGSWFDPSFCNERIPTLREVLTLVDHRRWINIELKEDFLGRAPRGLLERAVLDAVEQQGYRNHVLCSSFSHRIRWTLRSFDPEIPIGVIYNFRHDFFSSPSRLAASSGACAFVCGKLELRSSMIRDAHQHGLAVYVYTLDSPQDVRRMVKNGVCGVLSNNADDVAEILMGETCRRH